VRIDTAANAGTTTAAFHQADYVFWNQDFLEGLSKYEVPRM